jgi:hypothetical protein
MSLSLTTLDALIDEIATLESSKRSDEASYRSSATGLVKAKSVDQLLIQNPTSEIHGTAEAARYRDAVDRIRRLTNG